MTTVQGKQRRSREGTSIKSKLQEAQHSQQTTTSSNHLKIRILPPLLSPKTTSHRSHALQTPHHHRPASPHLRAPPKIQHPLQNLHPSTNSRASKTPTASPSSPPPPSTSTLTSSGKACPSYKPAACNPSPSSSPTRPPTAPHTAHLTSRPCSKVNHL